MVKGTKAMLRQLKQDMDGFAAFEMPNFPDISDPSIKLPLTRFKGDYQRIKDEIAVVDRTPGIEPQISVREINDIAANLRFLQRSYRTYANNEMVPAPTTPECQVGMDVTEGFGGSNLVDDAYPDKDDSRGPSVGGWWNNLKSALTSDPDYSDDPNYDRITPVQLEILIQKLNIELVRLQASGSTDPVIQARVNVFTKIKYSLTNVQKDVKSGAISPNAIPIRVSDYNTFLPALDMADSEIPSLINKTGVAGLFGKFLGNDSSGNEIDESLLNKYSNALLSGLSYKVDINYVSPNEVAIHQADAVKAMYENGGGLDIDPGFFESFETGHPMTMSGSRGEFEDITRQLDKEGFEGSMGIRKPRRQKPAGTFDWKKRSQEIYENVLKAGMKPADYGFNPAIYAKGGAAADFSWRGHTKMVCNRLATHSDNAMPEQLGCPPASWKGWRS
jgi:hypothetical protein